MYHRRNYLNSFSLTIKSHSNNRIDYSRAKRNEIQERVKKCINTCIGKHRQNSEQRSSRRLKISTSRRNHKSGQILNLNLTDNFGKVKFQGECLLPKNSYLNKSERSINFRDPTDYSSAFYRDLGEKLKENMVDKRAMIKLNLEKFIKRSKKEKIPVRLLMPKRIYPRCQMERNLQMEGWTDYQSSHSNMYGKKIIVKHDYLKPQNEKNKIRFSCRENKKHLSFYENQPRAVRKRKTLLHQRANSGRKIKSIDCQTQLDPPNLQVIDL
ncbi:unnamed protein product [Moneuplotes crassus]|uniref:Uncharacterized protein n=1 Tax=Euplotes crassus TaxID=5936 RepID=A0AAD2D0U3_EUPCR|nr:unnamed protein product [Moneuplotes crassus]